MIAYLLDKMVEWLVDRSPGSASTAVVIKCEKSLAQTVTGSTAVMNGPAGGPLR